MKKLFLSILVLGFLLSGCATPPPSNELQKQLIDQGDIKIGMSYLEIKILIDTMTFYPPLRKTSKRFIYGTTNSGSDVTYGFEMDEELKFTLYSDKVLDKYKLVKIFQSSLERYNYYLSKEPIHMKDKLKLMKHKNMILDHQAHVAKQEKQKEEENKSEAEKIQIELAEMINKAKDTCKTLGFEEGTDKFTDCALKLYTQEVDNIVALKVAEQKVSSSSSSGSMTIYDPVRDRQNQIDRGMKMLGGGCTLGIDC